MATRPNQNSPVVRAGICTRISWHPDGQRAGVERQRVDCEALCSDTAPDRLMTSLFPSPRSEALAALLDRGHIAGEVGAALADSGTVFAVFDQQDSGCHSCGVEIGGERFFGKSAVEERAIPSLRRAAALHRAVTHPAIIPLLAEARTDVGLLLVYPWVDGEVLYGAPASGRSKRLDPEGPHARFRSLPVAEVLAAIRSILDAHVVVSAMADEGASGFRRNRPGGWGRDGEPSRKAVRLGLRHGPGRARGRTRSE